MRLTIERFLATVVVALTVIVAAPAGLAHADASVLPPEHLLKKQVLTNEPLDWMDLGRVERPGGIYLAAGDYDWFIGIIGGNDCVGKLKIATSGTYAWRAQLDPKNGFYFATSVLEGPHKYSSVKCTTNVPSSREWTWGSTLKPLFG